MRPASLGRPWRWLRWWGAAGGAGLLLAGCSGAHEPTHGVAAAGTKHAQIASTANVPALLGISIDSLRARLGPPQPLPPPLRANVAALAGAANGRDSVATFRTGGLIIAASYDARSRRVRELLLLGHHEDSLMGRAALRANAPTYLILPVFYAGSSSRLLGLRIIATE